VGSKGPRVSEGMLDGIHSTILTFHSISRSILKNTIVGSEHSLKASKKHIWSNSTLRRHSFAVDEIAKN
jgi:hypothetical protein